MLLLILCILCMSKRISFQFLLSLLMYNSYTATASFFAFFSQFTYYCTDSYLSLLPIFKYSSIFRCRQTDIHVDMLRFSTQFCAEESTQELCLVACKAEPALSMASMILIGTGKKGVSQAYCQHIRNNH